MNNNELRDMGFQLVQLKDYVNSFSGGTPNTANREFYIGDINFIGSGEIGQNTTQKTINIDAINNSSANIIDEGDILYAMYGATAGNIAISPISGAINQAILCIRPNHHLCKEFLFQQLQYMKKDILQKYIQGGQGNLSAGQILSLNIKITSLKNQEKIGKLLSLIDDLITLERQKLTKIKQTNEFYNNLIFSSKFSGNEVIKLSSIVSNVNRDRVVDTSAFEKITLGLNNTGTRFANLGREMADTRPFYLRKKDEILIGKQNYFSGSIALISEEFDNTICSNALVSFTIDENKAHNYFIYKYLANKNYIRKRSALANGTGQKELSESDLFNFTLNIPNLETQKKHVQLLKAFDELIVEQENMISSLQKLKKYHLNNIFK